MFDHLLEFDGGHVVPFSGFIFAVLASIDRVRGTRHEAAYSSASPRAQWWRSVWPWRGKRAADAQSMAVATSIRKPRKAHAVGLSRR
jgi:hypothetical protein